MSREYPCVICLRVSQATFDKLEVLQEKLERTASEVAREALIHGIARLEVEKHVK